MKQEVLKNKKLYTKNKHANCQIGDLDIIRMSKKYPPQQLHIDTTNKSGSSSDLYHAPVLLEQVLAVLEPKEGEAYLDLTAGYGGHASKVIEATGAPEKAVLVDRDVMAIDSLKQFAKRGVSIMHQDFASAAKALAQRGALFDMILIDLGVSSPQLDKKERGFSFQAEAMLDMRMDQRESLTAKDLVNTLSFKELSQLIEVYGEERPGMARKIAQVIVDHRPIETTLDLAKLIKQHYYRGEWSRTHPATRTFQALRMEVNDELGQIRETLPLLVSLLRENGRLAIISFHSLEDRLVKQFLKDEATSGYEAQLRLLTKKPILGAAEDVNNPRARSAKLRAAVKNKNHERT